MRLRPSGRPLAWPDTRAVQFARTDASGWWEGSWRCGRSLVVGPRLDRDTVGVNGVETAHAHIAEDEEETEQRSGVQVVEQNAGLVADEGTDVLGADPAGPVGVDVAQAFPRRHALVGERTQRLDREPAHDVR